MDNVLPTPTKPVLLVSEQHLRDTVYVSDSTNSKLIISSIREVQDVNLATVIGTDFLLAIEAYVEQKSIPDKVKHLLDNYIRPYLTYEAAAAIVKKSNFHIGNKGVVTSHETIETKWKIMAGEDMVHYYANLAGSHLRRLTQYILLHYQDYQEYLNGINEIRNHLDARVDTGLYLGGTPHYKYKIDPGKLR